MSQKLLEARWRMNGQLERRAVDPGQGSVASQWYQLFADYRKATVSKQKNKKSNPKPPIGFCGNFLAFAGF